jgi:hypothetical protein
MTGGPTDAANLAKSHLPASISPVALVPVPDAGVPATRWAALGWTQRTAWPGAHSSSLSYPSAHLETQFLLCIQLRRQVSAPPSLPRLLAGRIGAWLAVINYCLVPSVRGQAVRTHPSTRHPPCANNTRRALRQPVGQTLTCSTAAALSSGRNRSVEASIALAPGPAPAARVHVARSAHPFIHPPSTPISILPDPLRGAKTPRTASHRTRNTLIPPRPAFPRLPPKRPPSHARKVDT